jgi:glycosyltransferase involved in cell wall biosynthesis
VLKISVVVPSFNQGKFLEETIVSILSQNYPSLEIFIIDGGSTDNSVEIIKKYEDRITGWISEKDNGQSDAINKGFRMCTGDIVSWLCSDDLYTPGTLNKINELYSALPLTTGVIHGNSEIFNNEKVINFDKGYGNWTVERQLAGMTFPQPSSFMRRKTLIQAGLLNESLHYGMDYELFSRMIMISDFHYEDIFFSRYRLHDESKSTTAIAKFIDEWTVIFNSISEGLGIEKINIKLNEAQLKTKTDTNIVNFFRENRNRRNPDPDKMLFYFLVNVIRYDYASDRYIRVKNIANILKNEYGNFLLAEPSIQKIVKRSLNLPPFLLKFARDFKRTLSK